ncbi:response regulator transcription factor [Desulfuromonas acetoxidans]|uniref:Two component transcriptional regulator, winged helix family n=1 Tax=Desulfuromonas acetoxidans (strain DSM 684 / 11070) TaxID=281689 RepID=Q1K367_DESA6|nr:response regulator transcription factor [Desulfuromonas acetoxidans]EAT17107.1 two component transcriptional regulator, winged helix family [Desulfuromonas acetoxidans DSM 684]MBF0645669.1 response regulator transcription factor [Desulfuromonas acetoxidans]NVD24114.1 response regulator transcription factor [Desulfuromonas acetoxidans]NVE16410.1 response regulator transcription factor [Desulfuromonas acetoxidans]
MAFSMESERVVLVLTDDAQNCDGTVTCLSEDGFSPAVYHNAEEILGVCEELVPELVVIDVAESSLDVASSCRFLREQYTGPLVVLAEHADEMFQVLGLEMGADDFVVKPISATLLRARIRAVLRRRQLAETGEDATITLGSLEVDSGRREVSCGGKSVDLTSKEFDLLWYLARHARTVLSRDQIYEALFGLEYNGVDRSVDIYISRLRNKLGEDPSRPQLLKTVRGVGYLLGG